MDLSGYDRDSLVALARNLAALVAEDSGLRRIWLDALMVRNDPGKVPESRPRPTSKEFQQRGRELMSQFGFSPQTAYRVARLELSGGVPLAEIAGMSISELSRAMRGIGPKLGPEIVAKLAPLRRQLSDAMEALEERVVAVARDNPERMADMVRSWLTAEGMEVKRKAAVLLVTLGPEISSNILRHLDEQVIDQISAEIVRLERLTTEVRTQILRDCEDELMGNYAEQLLERTQSHRAG